MSIKGTLETILLFMTVNCSHNINCLNSTTPNRKAIVSIWQHMTSRLRSNRLIKIIQVRLKAETRKRGNDRLQRGTPITPGISWSYQQLSAALSSLYLQSKSKQTWAGCLHWLLKGVLGLQMWRILTNDVSSLNMTEKDWEEMCHNVHLSTAVV